LRLFSGQRIHLAMDGSKNSILSFAPERPAIFGNKC